MGALLETWLGSGLFEGPGEGRRVSFVLGYLWKPLHLSCVQNLDTPVCVTIFRAELSLG